ncbi:MAG: hypothetical protein J4469_00960 [Candidatus Aenigmarchaeota archaeon]|nr:hypothetical protein [Candidatus Aenigmarchaeota archaeon]
MIPEVIFRYSWFYDQNFKKIHKKEKDYPSHKNILDYIKQVQKLWGRYEKEILHELSVITGLKWKEKRITCYVVGRCIPFSDPLTLPVIEKYPDYFIDNLVHELIHQLFTQNGNIEKSKRAWNYINRKYRDKPFNTRIHIPLHAIHSHIYLRFFNEKRLSRDIKLIKFLPEYKKSWEIVREEGYKKIISEFRERVKS